jgi:malate synthase
MTAPVDAGNSAGVEIAPALQRFIDEEVLPGTGVAPQRFWSGLVALLRQLAPRNGELLAKRDRLQRRLDAWHRERPGAAGLGRDRLCGGSRRGLHRIHRQCR